MTRHIYVSYDAPDGSTNIDKLDRDTGQVLQTNSSLTDYGNLSSEWENLDIDTDENLYLSGSENNVISLDSSLTERWDAGYYDQIQWRIPTSSGYVFEYAGGLVKLSLDDGSELQTSTETGFYDPAVDSDDAIFVHDYGSPATIYKFDSSLTQVASWTLDASRPRWLEVTTDGNLNFTTNDDKTKVLSNDLSTKLADLGGRDGYYESNGQFQADSSGRVVLPENSSTYVSVEDFDGTEDARYAIDDKSASWVLGAFADRSGNIYFHRNASSGDDLGKYDPDTDTEVWTTTRYGGEIHDYAVNPDPTAFFTAWVNSATGSSSPSSSTASPLTTTGKVGLTGDSSIVGTTSAPLGESTAFASEQALLTPTTPSVLAAQGAESYYAIGALTPSSATVQPASGSSALIEYPMLALTASPLGVFGETGIFGTASVVPSASTIGESIATDLGLNVPSTSAAASSATHVERGGIGLLAQTTSPYSSASTLTATYVEGEAITVLVDSTPAYLRPLWDSLGEAGVEAEAEPPTPTSVASAVRFRGWNGGPDLNRSRTAGKLLGTDDGVSLSATDGANWTAIDDDS